MRSHRDLADLAEAQHGVVTYRQLRDLGFSKGHISRSSEADRLRRVHRGVYAVGHAGLSRHGRCHAAVLACGSGTVLSHHSAAWLWGLLPSFPAAPEVSARGGRHRRRGIAVHRDAVLGPTDWGLIDRIPVTSLPRTLLDLAATGSTRRLEHAIDRAKRLDLLELPSIDSMLARRGRTAGARRLRRALELYRTPVYDRARSELLFLAAIEKEGLPKPAINTFVAGHEIDAYWAAWRFAVEVDGWETHGTIGFGRRI
jgi:predicted transcriptional regulator of viral defense system